jgi:hypothetical protein
MLQFDLSLSLSLYIYMEETDFFCKFVHPNRAISRTSHMPVCLLGMGVGVNGSCPTATGWDGTVSMSLEALPATGCWKTVQYY